MHYTVHPDMVRRASTSELRDAFLIGGLFHPGAVELRYSEVDRVVIGGASPDASPLELPCPKSLAATYFCERRELGIVNVGGKGSVTVDGQSYPLGTLDTLYVGRGSKAVSFQSGDGDKPAQFYLISYAAHTAYPTTLVSYKDVTPKELGSRETANERKLYQMIVPGRVQSCQLVLGSTHMQAGSVWNTMPPHTHLRRSEIYLYFNIKPGAAVFHFMGEPQETRHLLVHEKDVVISPSWSIHSGAGTGAYSFVWAMGGENQAFDDMDGINIADIR